MASKINVILIIVDHLETLKDYRTKKYFIFDILVLFIFPSLLGLTILLSGFILTKELVSVLATIMSIFAALLFNLLLLTFDIVAKAKKSYADAGDNHTNSKRYLLLKEIYSNISFSILQCIISIIMLLTFLVCKNDDIINAVSFVTYFLILSFILHLFMILKRIHIMLKTEFDL